MQRKRLKNIKETCESQHVQVKILAYPRR